MNFLARLFHKHDLAGDHIRCGQCYATAVFVHCRGCDFSTRATAMMEMAQHLKAVHSHRKKAIELLKLVEVGSGFTPGEIASARRMRAALEAYESQG